MSRKDKAVVLLSGGMDSCVAAAMAGETHELALVHAGYGQRTEQRERRAFEEIADYWGVRERLVVRLEHLALIGGSALTDKGIAVPEDGRGILGTDKDSTQRHRGLTEAAEDAPEDSRFKIQDSRPEKTRREPKVTQGDGPAQTEGAVTAGIPVTYVPFRNAHFLALAVSWAEVIGARAVYIGAVAEDSSGYPDCRPDYYRAFQEVVRQGTRPETGIEIVTPVIGMRKSEIVRRGIALGAPLHLTWSCYQNEDAACGACDSCRLRLRAFAEAGRPDPIPYRVPIASAF